MAITILDVPTLEGADCVRVISSALRIVPGIVGVQVDVQRKQVVVDFDSALINEVQVIELCRDTGYAPK